MGHKKGAAKIEMASRRRALGTTSRLSPTYSSNQLVSGSTPLEIRLKSQMPCCYASSARIASARSRLTGRCRCRCSMLAAGRAGFTRIAECSRIASYSSSVRRK